MTPSLRGCPRAASPSPNTLRLLDALGGSEAGARGWPRSVRVSPRAAFSVLCQGAGIALQTSDQSGISVFENGLLTRKLSGRTRACKEAVGAAPTRRTSKNVCAPALEPKFPQAWQKGGTLTLYYYSTEELDALLERLL